MDEISFADLLKTNHMFASLDETTRNLLVSKFKKVSLIAGEFLFYQGDPSDSIYLLISGKLAAVLMNGLGESRIIGQIAAGESVGEMGALSNEPRTLSIKALTDAVLLKLSASDFIEISHQYPSVMYETIRPLVSRSIGILKTLSVEKRNTHTLIVPAHRKIALENFSNQLDIHASPFTHTLIISDYHPEFIGKTVDVHLIKLTIKKMMSERKSIHRICYLASSFDSPVAKAGFQNANQIYVVAHVDSEQKIDHHILEQIESRRSHFTAYPSLILLHPPEAKAPKHTNEWLKLSNFFLCHHVRMDKPKDFQRLLRFIRGKAVGLVLSGGGTRGWAHIGAIKALREAKIPIDIIGGTSVGALVACLYARYPSYEKIFELFKELTIASKGTISWRSLTWPIISLFSIEKYTNGLIKLFDQIRIEDLWLPVFCITSNLSNSTEDIHQKGLAWQIIRASTSLPGIAPPMLLDGQIHLDGGLLNNLPVDVMRQYVGINGKVIAIELNKVHEDKNTYDFPPILTLKDALLNKLRIKGHHYTFPKFTDIFIKGLFLKSRLNEAHNAIIANMYVNLDLAQFSMLHSHPHEWDKLVDLGYQETLRQITKMKK